MKRILLTLSLCILSLSFAFGQTSREEINADLGLTAGMCCTYRPSEQKLTPAPRGFRPVYISHFGRHGSRYHTWDQLYSSCYQMLSEIDSLLTPQGKELLGELREITDDAYLRIGDLTQRGLEEQRGIARRMYRNFKPLLGGKGVKIRSYSTKVHRTILSMTAFVESLSKCNPSLEFEITASLREQQHLNHEKAVLELKDQYQQLYSQTTYENSPYRLLEGLVADKDFLQDNPQWCYGFFDRLIQVALVLPAQESPYDLLPLFTPEELFRYWKKDNYRMYLQVGPSPEFGDAVTSDAIPLLENIIESADCALLEGSPGATLRFGHDLNFVPFVSLLGLNGLDKVEANNPEELWQNWSNFKVTPFATNFQLVFYRNRRGEVLVKALLNEAEASFDLPCSTAPYYPWPELKEYLKERMQKYNN